MKMYFIDFENIGTAGLKRIQTVNEEDRYYIFYSDACLNISEEILQRIRDKGGTVELYKVDNGVSNALDFQLSSYLGYIIRGRIHMADEFIIVSKDKGYDVVCKFWQRKGFLTTRMKGFTNGGSPPKTITELELKPYLDKELTPHAAEILHVINHVGNTQRLYAFLGKLLHDAKRAGIIYQKLKPLYLSRFKDCT